jgi:uncharacterized protein YndB with AHSA1/START domain
MNDTGSLKVTTPTDREIVITRVFDAPRALVFDAMSKSELLKRWLLGPPGWAMVDCENDLKVGGAFRHVWRKADGAEMAMRGVYREVVRPERIVRTEIFELGCGPGRRAGSDTCPDRTRRQDRPHAHGGLPVEGGPRRHNRLRHGARRCGELRQVGGVVAVDRIIEYMNRGVM